MAAEGTTDPIGVSIAGAVATVTMRTPALTTLAKQALLEALRSVAGDDTVRAVVLTGSGRMFCAGQDLGEHAAALRADAGSALATVGEHYNLIVTALTSAPKPVLAAVNGTCAGAGLSLALACDVRIGADTAKFATAFTGIGLSFDSGMSATLARAVGTARASELIMLGEPFGAQQALSWGLLGRVVTAEALPAITAELGRRLASGPTPAYAAAKAAMARAWAAPMADVLAGELADQVRLGTTRDHRAATESFLAKQRPEFTGR